MMKNLAILLFGVALPVWVAVGLIAYLVHGDGVDGFLSAALGMTTTMLIAAVFTQPGTVKLSPQREVAIETGHSDRRTLFEHSLLGPVMWVILSVAHRMAMPRVKAWLRRTLVAEGNANYYTPEEYLALALASGLGAGLACELIGLLWLGGLSLFMLVLGFALGLLLSLYHLHSQASKRLRTISKRVPYALDLVSLAMGAGATFTEAVKTVVYEDPEDPFNVELKTVLAEMELGSTRRTALQNLADRVPLDNLRSIVASVIQAEELGTPLGEVLHAQASLLRLQRSVRAENAAAVASVRMLVPCLLIMVSVVLAVFGPAIVKAVKGGLF
jgi:tight adherence protein C